MRPDVYVAETQRVCREGSVGLEEKKSKGSGEIGSDLLPASVKTSYSKPVINALPLL